MSWDAVEKDFVKPKTPEGDAFMSSTAGTRKGAIYLTVRSARLDGLAWFAGGQKVSVMIGSGANAGTLRIIPGGPYPLRRFGAIGKGGDRRGVVLVSPELHRALRVSADPHPTMAVEIDWSDTWLEVMLPAWAVGNAPPAAVKPAPVAAVARPETPAPERKPGEPFRGMASRTGVAGSAGVASSPIPVERAR